MTEALKLMTTSVGDEQMTVCAFDPNEARFGHLLRTTWNELEELGLIEERGEKPGPTFRLTPLGWLNGFRMLDMLEDPQMRSRVVAIRKALKGRVKGRHAYDGSSVYIKDLAAELAVPVGWVWNALSAGLLQEFFPDHTMNAFLASGILVRIPATFDMETLD